MPKPISFVGLALAIFATAGASFALSGCGAHEQDASWREIAAAKDVRFEEGASLYSRYCALCHGEGANGYAADHAPSLVSPTYLESASDQMIAKGIREGRPGTAMAPYGKVRGGPLDEEQILKIVAFVRDHGPAYGKLPDGPVNGDAIRGEAVYAESCQSCHGTRTERGNAVHLANAQFLASASDPFLRHAIVHGRPGTPMPGFGGALKDTEIDDVVAFLRTWATRVDPARRAPPEPPPLGDFVIHPRGPSPDFTLRAETYVPIADVKKALDEGKRIVIIDARATSDWYTMHIPGSISVPYYGFSRLGSMPKDGTWITAYCACPHHASGAVVAELRKRGFTHTAVLDEGILEWKKRGYPVESTPLPPE